jgi:hypothetical protein
MPYFTSTNINKSIILEVFTDSNEERDALKQISSMLSSANKTIKENIKKILGKENKATLKTLLNKINFNKI